MSYQVLARRWRPQAFDQMVGQEHVLRALVNALGSNRLHHAYLLTGTRGVGKTTLARLIAKCLNCEQGVSATPCGQCSACREIAEGRFVDLLEVDAASRTKVEDTRELLDNVLYAPARGRYKVYLIDEVHMLSGHSFNALLKTLEEPPPHVKFLLATTDPQKLPATVLSRCLQLHLRNLSPEQIAGHLAHVLAQEGLESEAAGLWQIAVAAQGSMRDALSLTDQAIAHGGGKVAAATVSEMLGYVEREQLRTLLDALLAADAAHVLQAVEALAAQGADCERVLAELLVDLHRVALVQAVPAALESVHGDREQFARWADAATPADVQLYYQIGLQCRRDLPYAPDARSGLEMALLRMLAFRPAAAPRPGSTSVVGSSAPAREVAGLAKKSEPTAGGRPDGVVRPTPTPTPTSTSVAVAVPSPASEPSPVVRAGTLLAPEPSAPTRLQSAAAEAVVMPHEPAAGVEPAADEIPLRLEALNASNWATLLAELPLAGMARSLAMHALPRRVLDGRVELDLDPRHAALHAPAATERLSAALAAHFGCDITLQLHSADPGAETPAGRELRLLEERREAAVAHIEADANVRLLLESFAGRLHRESIRAVDALAPQSPAGG